MSTFARVEQDDIFDESSQFSGRLVNHPDITFRFLHRHFPVVCYYWREHFALILSVICIGGMAGLTKLLFPLIGHMVYARKPSEILDFVVAFGIAKAICSAVIGVAADECGRTNLLRIGWVFGLPIFPIIMLADSWQYIVMANWLMGVQQGICWSVTIFMMVDLASMKNKAVVIALNEFVGFFVVSVVTILSSFQKSNTTSIHDFDSAFWGGLILAVSGTVISLILPETHGADHTAILQRYYRMFSLELHAEVSEHTDTEMSDYSHTEGGMYSDIERQTLAALAHPGEGTTATTTAATNAAGTGTGAGADSGANGGVDAHDDVGPTDGNPLSGSISSVDPRMGTFVGDPNYHRPPAPAATATAPVSPSFASSTSTSTSSSAAGVGRDATDMSPPLASDVEEGLHTLHNDLVSGGIAYRARRANVSVGPFAHEEALSPISLFSPAPPPPMRNFTYPLLLLWDTAKASVTLTVASWGTFATCFTALCSAAKDGLMWGLAPLFYKSFNLKMDQVGLLIAGYFLALALLQVFAGFLADRGHTKAILLAGLALEAYAILYVAWSPRAVLFESPAHRAFPLFMVGSLMMGIGQACIIPTLHHSMIQNVVAEKHSTALGVLRMWRGFGTAFGAGVGGLLQNAYGYVVTFSIAGVMLLVCVVLVGLCIDEMKSHADVLPSPSPANSPTYGYDDGSGNGYGSGSGAVTGDRIHPSSPYNEAEEEEDDNKGGVGGAPESVEAAVGGEIMEIHSNIDEMEASTPY